jgi:hypothetical protein
VADAASYQKVLKVREKRAGLPAQCVTSPHDRPRSAPPPRQVDVSLAFNLNAILWSAGFSASVDYDKTEAGTSDHDQVLPDGRPQLRRDLFPLAVPDCLISPFPALTETVRHAWTEGG